MCFYLICLSVRYEDVERLGGLPSIKNIVLFTAFAFSANDTNKYAERRERRLSVVHHYHTHER